MVLEQIESEKGCFSPKLNNMYFYKNDTLRKNYKKWLWNLKRWAQIRCIKGGSGSNWNRKGLFFHPSKYNVLAIKMIFWEIIVRNDCVIWLNELNSDISGIVLDQIQSKKS